MRTLLLTIAIFFNTAVRSQQEHKTYEQLIPGTDFKFRMIALPAGTFKMGSPESEAGRQADEGPARTFTLSPFWMGETEITFDVFNTYFNDESFSRNQITDAITRPSSPYIDLTAGMGKAGGYPANSMQPYNVVMFCKWLYHKTGIYYRLPTEAEWEYACRAGSETTYPFGTDDKSLGEYAWYRDNSEMKYHQVGLKKPNAWGLYDMLGNVAEWTLDQYDAQWYSKVKDTDPFLRAVTRYPRTVRGGSYRDPSSELRPSQRTPNDPVWNRRDPQVPKSKWWNADAPFVGFRLVRPYKQPTPEEAELFFNEFLK